MENSPTLRFGGFELQARHRRLLHGGEPVSVGARPFDLLVALAYRRERVVTKAELLDLVWPGLVVEENNLQVQVSLLRKLLGPQAIATIPGRGYRFTAKLDAVAEAVSIGAAGNQDRQLSVDDGTRTMSPDPSGRFPRLYGRETDLLALRDLMDAHRAVTIVGAGGIGKSRLAQEAAHTFADRWPDGARTVELAGLTDPALLPNVVAQALGIDLSDPPGSLHHLVAGLEPRRLLLLLDNCEHLLDAVAALAQAVLQGTPHVMLLLTSQEPLHLPAEQQYRIEPLAVPPAGTSPGARSFGSVALFEARARAVDRHFVLSDEALILVVDICRRLDGLPLAIELAAARVAVLGLRSVRDKLDERFRLLTGGSRAATRRHQTLRATLEWSYSLLSEDERAVFRRLGVFAGGFTMALAQTVAGDAQAGEWTVLDHLSALVDKSLVVARAGDPPRYSLLESARAFALEELADENADVLRRHALAMRQLFAEVDGANLDGELRTDQLDGLLLPELDNIRAAHSWSISESGEVGIAVSLAASASALDDFAWECAGWLTPLERQVRDGAVAPEVAARYWRALASSNMVDRVPLGLQLEAATHASVLYKTLAQPRRAFSSLVQLARHRWATHEDELAQLAADEARNLVRPEWPALLRIRLLRIDGYLARRAGRLADALALFHEAVRVSVSSGDWLLEVIARSNLADLLWLTGPIEAAADEACQLASELRARPAAADEMAWLFANLVGILSEMGRIDDASAAACEALPLMRRTKRYFVEVWVYLFWRRGQFGTSARMLGRSDAEQDRARVPLQENERRLIVEARAGLAAEMGAYELARERAVGVTLSEVELLEIFSEALSRPVRNSIFQSGPCR